MNREWITEYLFEKKISFLSLKKPKCVWEAFSYIYLLYVYKQQKCIITMIHKCIRCGITFEQPFYLQSRNSTFICTLATIMIWTCTMRFNLSIRLLIPFDMFLLSLTLHVRPVSPLFRLNWHKRSSLTNCFRWEKFPLELLTFPRCELLPIFQSNLKHINTIAKSVAIRYSLTVVNSF